MHTDDATEIMPDPIRFGRAVCGTLAEAERREWWIANGSGGYAGGTIAGTLTRRYHGLLIAPVEPPLGRRLVFAKADATLLDGARSYPLFSNRWGSGQIAPAGHLDIESFCLDLSVPVWTFALAGRRIEARIWMEPGLNMTWIGWFLHPVAGEAASLSLRVTLLANNRDHNGETWEDGFQPSLSVTGDTLRVEAARGLGDRDAHLRVGEASLALRPGSWCGMVASLCADPPGDVAAALERRLAHDRGVLAAAARLVSPVASLAPPPRDRLASRTSGGTSPDVAPSCPSSVPVAAPPAVSPPVPRANPLATPTTAPTAIASALDAAPPWVTRLVLAADAFLFARPSPEEPDGQSVIAGYPWFGDWGRDTMISLPGLALATGRHDVALRILRTFSRFVSQGMLPNVFPGAGDAPEYNTADASLWFFDAWRAYVAATGDIAALRTAFPVLADMIAWHRRGTRYGIVVDPADGLLRAGEAGVQLTWMDAKVGDWVVTPRIGKPVEINALWHNALCIMADFTAMLGEIDVFSADAAAARAGFRRFVRSDGQGLYDVIDGPDGLDDSVRPNQIFAVSLTHSPLAADDRRGVVETCRRHLLTSYGLRSLAPGSAGYHPRYGGDVRQRDGGYHQGPVWGWLLGHFVLAEYRVTGDIDAALTLLAPIRDALFDQGLGTIGEIFDGDPPHDPRGAPAQAWSVACTLQAWHELREAHASTQGS